MRAFSVCSVIQSVNRLVSQSSIHSLVSSVSQSVIHSFILTTIYRPASPSNLPFIDSDPGNYPRRLLRFSVKIDNLGLADFRPNVPRSKWIWHKCHKHYHSMETFSSYDLISKSLICSPVRGLVSIQARRLASYSPPSHPNKKVNS